MIQDKYVSFNEKKCDLRSGGVCQRSMYKSFNKTLSALSVMITREKNCIHTLAKISKGIFPSLCEAHERNPSMLTGIQNKILIQFRKSTH